MLLCVIQYVSVQSSADSGKWCLQLQEVMVHSMWGNEILALPHCAADLAEDGQLINFGPRVRIGMCEGNPTMVMPHSTSGRCDYWGPFVNR